MNIFNTSQIRELFNGAQTFVQKANSTEKDQAFATTLEGALKTQERESPLDLSRIGVNLAKKHLQVSTGQKPKLEGYKNDNSKNHLRKLLETGFAFFGNQDKIDASPERKSKIADAIFKIGQGFATEVEKYKRGALDIFTRIKNRIGNQKDAGAQDALEAFGMNPVKKASDTIYGKTNTTLGALNNPMLDYGTEPEYSKIKPEHVVPALKEASSRAKAQINQILKLLKADPSEDDKNMTFENTLVALSEAEAILSDVSRIFRHIESVNITSGFRTIQEEANDIVSDFYNYLGNDDKITELKERYIATAGAKAEEGPRARYIKDLELNMKLSGAQLKGVDKENFNNFRSYALDI